MALAGAIGGERAAFVVVPLSAAGLVLVAFLLGRRLGGADTALIAAAAVATSPIVMFQSLQPMSDVPAAFWWSLAPAAADALVEPDRGVCRRRRGRRVHGAPEPVRPGRRCSRGSSVVVARLDARSRAAGPRLRDAAGDRAVAFVVPAAGRCSAVRRSTRLRRRRDPVLASHTSGANVGRYARWTIVCAVRADRSCRSPRRSRFGAAGSSPRSDRGAPHAWRGAALMLYRGTSSDSTCSISCSTTGCISVFSCPRCRWCWCCRAPCIAAVCRRVPLPLRGLAVLLAAVLVASWGVGRARSLGAFQLQHSEQRYLDVAEFVRGLPPDAVFVTLQHSGSLLVLPVRDRRYVGTGSMPTKSIARSPMSRETGRPRIRASSTTGN